MKSFITGSRAYGTHRPGSDLDLCVFMEESTLDILVEEFGFPIRIGKLNIIPCTSAIEMVAWDIATKKCLQLARTSKDKKLSKTDAIAVHEAERAKLGVVERFRGSDPVSEDDRAEIQAYRKARYDA